MSVFTLTRPDHGPIPVLVEVPHAGLTVPDAVPGGLYALRESVRRDADIYVDQLYQDAPTQGATLLCAKMSRYVVDLNRGPDDIDPLTVQGHPNPQPHRPRGVIWRMSTGGHALLPRALQMGEYQARLSEYYHPYHQVLSEELRRIRAAFGHVILVAAHSMPSMGRRAVRGPVSRQADVVPGSLGRTSADPQVIDYVDRHFRSAGFSVAHDDPYRGGWTTQHYGRVSEGVHAIQIELNRDLYVTEETGAPREESWSALQACLMELIAGLGTLRLPESPG
jgi:N-formylglutamate amidohydrolase